MQGSNFLYIFIPFHQLLVLRLSVNACLRSWSNLWYPFLVTTRTDLLTWPFPGCFPSHRSRPSLLVLLHSACWFLYCRLNNNTQGLWAGNTDRGESFQELLLHVLQVNRRTLCHLLHADFSPLLIFLVLVSVVCRYRAIPKQLVLALNAV